MATFTENCRRCGAGNTAFHVIATNPTYSKVQRVHGVEHTQAEVFCICNSCGQSLVAVITKRQSAHETGNGLIDTAIKKSFNEVWQGQKGFQALNEPVDFYAAFDHFVQLKSKRPLRTPEHLPPEIEPSFVEGNRCFENDCFNAAGAMYRLTLDLSTKKILRGVSELPNARVMRSLGLRLDWMFDNELLPEALRELADCIKEDGNDGAHDASLSSDDASDLYDFVFELVEQIFTYPKRLEVAKERRATRRSQT